MVKSKETKPQSNKNAEDNSSLSIIDFLRIIGGILLLNAFLSWWFTSTSTWGYQGRLIDPKYLKFKILNKQLNLTIDELSMYNGSDTKLPIYIGIYGKVYDVSNSRQVYGPGGSYGFFSGKDGARAFHTGCFQKSDEFTYDLRGLNFDEAIIDIKVWQDYYESSNKYWFVGYVQHENLTGNPPAPCNHMKFPGSNH